MNGLGDPDCNPSQGRKQAVILADSDLGSFPHSLCSRTQYLALPDRTLFMLLFYKLEKRGGDQLELSNLLRDWGFLKAP